MVPRGGDRHRLAGAELHLPRLADTRADLHPLVVALLEETGPARPGARRLTPAAWTVLEAYAFPGNGAELRSMLERGLALAEGGPIDVVHLPAAIVGAVRA